jgi:hypothetical protein
MLKEHTIALDFSASFIRGPPEKFTDFEFTPLSVAGVVHFFKHLQWYRPLIFQIFNSLEPFRKAFNGQPVAVFDALRRDSLEIFVCAVLEIDEHPVA